jgi:hypothetical protein
LFLALGIGYVFSTRPAAVKVLMNQRSGVATLANGHSVLRVGMEEDARLKPVFDVLRRRRPDLMADFARSYPELKDALEGRSILRPGSGEPGGLEGRRIRRPGSGEAGGTGTTSDLAKTAIVESKADLNEVLQVLTRRVKLLARLGLAASVVSSLSSAGMIAAVVGGNSREQIITATITLLASLFGLVTIYVEDFSGGEGSTRRLRDLMTTQVRRLAEIDGQLRLALAQDDSAKILSSITDINSVLVEVQHVRAQLGLAVSRAGSSRGQTKRAAA